MDVPVEEYTIGWISALSVEAVAARSMLDEINEHPFQSIPGDKNSYIRGKIGEHHVVIAILPATGAIAAGQAATNLTRTFPSTRYIFMVGIGGGIPRPKYDIKLGDIVVSVPTDQSPGVRQIDIGKEEEDGFKLEGSLNQPDITLLGAIKKLQVLHDMDEGQIHSLVKHHPRGFKKKVQDKLAYPGSKGQKGSQPPGECQECNQSETWPEPDIHYGIIASGSKVIKSATVRDRIGETFNACCVEMEAYGLMNYFGCLVIRGISDYADGQKNDMWQGYASLTAAAYAKDLLLSMPVAQVRHAPVLLKIGEVVSEIKDRVDHVIDEQKDRDRVSLTEWLTGYANIKGCPCTSPYDQETHGRRQNTSGWFLKKKEFQDWLQSAGGGLLCHGIPGCGKTTISTAVIAHLERIFGYDEKGSSPVKSRFSFVYCRGDDSKEQTTNHLLAVLLARLLPRYSDLPSGLKDLFEQKKRKPSQNELIECMAQMARDHEIFLVIDGIDECDRGVREELLPAFQRLQHASVRIMITTRVYSIALREPFGQILIQPDPTELGQYLKARVGALKAQRGKLLHEACDEIEDRIKVKLNELGSGSFLLAKLQINYYCDCLGAGGSDRSFDRKMTAPTDFYQATTDRIDGLGEVYGDLARRTLAWVTHAQRPLSIGELRHAVYFMRDGEYTSGSPFGPADLVQMCQGLVNLDTNNLVCVFHQTVKEHFHGPNGQEWLKISDLEIGSTCIDYLSNLTDPHAFQTEEAAIERMQQSPFLKYAGQHWGDHTRSVMETEGDLRSKALSFLDGSKARDLLHQIKHLHGKNSLQHTRNVLPIHMAASFDLHSLLHDIVERGDNIEAYDSRGQTALHVAIENGYLASVELLVEKGADLNRKDFTDGWTALHLAAWKGHEPLVNLLLEKRPTILVKNDRHGQTALHLAALNGKVSIVNKLLSSGFDAKTRDSNMWNVLHIMAWMGNTEMKKLLLDERKLDVGINSKGKRGLTPLHCAAGQGHKKLTTKLLAERADPNAVTSDGWTPLHWASVKRHDVEAPCRLKIRVDPSELRTKVAELQKELTDAVRSIDWFLKRAQSQISPRTYADIYETLKESTTPWATFKRIVVGWSSTIKEWFSKLEDASPAHVSMGLEIQDELSFMRCGTDCAHEEIVQTLLDNKADPHTKCQIDIQIESRSFSGYGFTCLHIAVLSGHEKVVRTLLRVSTNFKDLDQSCRLRLDKDTEAECTVFHLAVICGHTEIIDLLLKKDAKVALVNCQIRSGQAISLEIPPIMLAVFFRNQGVIPSLVKYGVNVNKAHPFHIHGLDIELELSALHLSILMGDSEIACSLFKYGATMDDTSSICQFKFGEDFSIKISVACMAALFQIEDLMLKLAEKDVNSGMVGVFQTQALQLELPFLYLAGLTMSDAVMKHVLNISPDITRMATFRFGDFVHIDLPVLPFLDPSAIPPGPKIAHQIEVCARAQLRMHFGDIDLRLSTFFMAALLQNRPMMLFLLESTEVDVNEVCDVQLSQNLSLQVSILHLVVLSGHADVAAWVLEKEANVNMELNITVSKNLEIRMTALHLASLRSDEAMVLLLLSKKVDAEQKCEISFCIQDGTTSTQVRVSLMALHLAILQGNIPFIQLLLPSHESPKKNTRFGVDLTSKMGNTETKIRTKPTAVYLAALVENSDVVTLLLDYGFHTTSGARMITMSGSTNDDTFLSYLVAVLGDLNRSKAPKRKRVKFKASLSALSLAILLENSTQTGQLLARADADKGHISQLEILSHDKAEGNVSLDLTTWHFASLTGHAPFIDHLIDAKADLNTGVNFLEPKQNRPGPTALQLAARFGHEAIIRCLIEQGADFQNKSARGESPLELARKHGHESIVNILLKMPVPIDKELAQKTIAQMHLNPTTRRNDTASTEVFKKQSKGNDSQDQGSWPSKGLLVFFISVSQVPASWNSFLKDAKSPTNEPTPKEGHHNEDETSESTGNPTGIENTPDGHPSASETRISRRKNHSQDESHSHSRTRSHDGRRGHHSQHRSKSDDLQRGQHSRTRVGASEKRRHRSRSNDSQHSHRSSRSIDGNERRHHRSRSNDSRHSHRSRTRADVKEKHRHRSRSNDSRNSSRHSHRRGRDTETTGPRGIWHHIKRTEIFSQAQAFVHSLGSTHESRERMESHKRNDLPRDMYNPYAKV